MQLIISSGSTSDPECELVQLEKEPVDEDFSSP
jgi:hypothetical protein